MRRKVARLALIFCAGCCCVFGGGVASLQTGARGRADSDAFGYVKMEAQAGDAGTASSNQVEAIKSIPADAFEAHEFQSRHKIVIPYRLLRPRSYEPKMKYPLVVVFHGSGAIGRDNVQQLGLLAKSWAQAEYREKYPCFVLVPQFTSRPVEYFRRAQSSVDVSRALPPLEAGLELVESLARSLNIDRSRIYVMGFSMGGSTTWNVLSLRPRMFAAGVSIAGIPDPASATRLRSVPLWVVHGNRDEENPFEGERLMYRALLESGAARVRFWELDGGGHKIPNRLLTTGELQRWLFEQRRQGRPRG
jgi:predicted peptidase